MFLMRNALHRLEFGPHQGQTLSHMINAKDDPFQENIKELFRLLDHHDSSQKQKEAIREILHEGWDELNERLPDLVRDRPRP